MNNLSEAVMKRGSTIFLKLVIIFAGLVVLALCIFAIPSFIKEGGVNELFTPFWVLIYLTTVPFYVASYQSIKMLVYIDRNTAFSKESVKALNSIKYCALEISLLYAICMPYVFKAADMDDAPGIILLWIVVIAAPIVIAVFAALLQKLLQNTIDIKTENDLTV